MLQYALIVCFYQLNLCRVVSCILLSRLYSEEGNPNARSLSLYDKRDILLTSFVARLCTFSIATF